MIDTQGRTDIPDNLVSLHGAEEQLRGKARTLIAADPRLQLHLAVTEAAMELADRLRQFNSNDENLKVTVMLGMRTFNAFAASIKLALSGYHQTAHSSCATCWKRSFCSTCSLAAQRSSSAGGSPTRKRV
ncbi:hypothetical protein ACQPTN_00640 [Bradyrhizobium sp. 13971]